MKALVIVDVQNDFTPGGALEVPEGDKVISVINDMQSAFDLVVATQDWHPRNHGSFASNQAGKNEYEKIVLNGLEQTLWPVHCVQNTVGAELHPALETSRIEAIFRKGVNPLVDSYSGFFDNGHKRSTGLAGYLREREVRQVYVCGLAADICAYYTAKDALDSGFETFFIKDAAMPLNSANYTSVTDHLKRLGVTIVSSSEIQVSEY